MSSKNEGMGEQHDVLFKKAWVVVSARKKQLAFSLRKYGFHLATSSLEAVRVVLLVKISQEVVLLVRFVRARERSRLNPHKNTAFTNEKR